MKARIGGKASPADLRRRRGFKGRQPLLKTRRAILRRGLNTQDGCERTAMNKTLAAMPGGLKTERVDVGAPCDGHNPRSRPCARSTEYQLAKRNARSNPKRHPEHRIANSSGHAELALQLGRCQR
jgi:hypothetical protein